MKKILLSLILVAGGLLTINAQTLDTLVVFETSADTTGWIIFENGANPADDDVMIVANPDTTGINPTDSVLMFNVNADAQPWAGMVLHDVFVGDSAIAITEDQHIFTMMVYRTSMGRVGFKLEREVADNSVHEVIVDNTVENEWEILTFDFSAVIGKTYQSIVLFPDFPDPAEGRTEGALVYIENVVFGEQEVTSAPLVQQAALKVYPNPAFDKLYVQHPNMTGYTISNMLGQAVERAQFGATGLKTIELGNLRTGIHFITVESNDGIHTTRFIKK